MFDVLITGGTVVDGTGSPGYRADIAITGETITALGDLSEATAKRIIDASGLVAVDNGAVHRRHGGSGRAVGHGR